MMDQFRPIVHRYVGRSPPSELAPAILNPAEPRHIPAPIRIQHRPPSSLRILGPKEDALICSVIF